MAEALPHGHRLDRGVAPRRAARAALPEGVEVKVLAGSFALGDGTWLNFATAFANLRPFWSTQFFLIIAATLLIALSASVWAVRWASRPLTTLAGAAERLGLDIGAPALSEEGPREVRLASRAFNEMQQRLQGFVRDRTQMLAAISHDLRTPITRMRLRAELVDDAEQRGKMLADLAEMEAMIAATLSFARDDPARESPEPLDLAALIQSLVADAADAGAEAHYQGPDLIGFTGRPTALKRAFGNLIDNAIAYGGSARVAAAVADQTITVTVADSGPGIPPDERDRVFEPFYRIEGSRSRETGGVGLGLAVVRSAVRAHGGEVELGDGPGGGLIVTVTLPRAAS
ncbi:MAG: HAMP domain-containing protein [Rhodospirillales bacterium]|nr:MAG: HAMP domain-containing protein [Rhodospirillales bacterium]